MLAVFCKPRELSGSPLSPAGTKRKLLEHNSLTPEEEEYVNGVLENLYSHVPKRSHTYVNEQYFGAGANGIAWVEGLTRCLATDEGGEVTAFFSGTLENNPSEDLEDAQFILQEYKRAFDTPEAGMGGVVPTMEALAQLRGPFAFIIYDRSHGRIVAARDAAGAEPLCWGTAMLSEGLLFASERSLIEGECADADSFPPGSVFVSDEFSTEGQLAPMNLEGARAELAEAARQAEALCRVESDCQLRRVESSSEIEAK